jgi:hypothetical protein
MIPEVVLSIDLCQPMSQADFSEDSILSGCLFFSWQMPD